MTAFSTGRSRSGYEVVLGVFMKGLPEAEKVSHYSALDFEFLFHQTNARVELFRDANTIEAQHFGNLDKKGCDALKKEFIKTLAPMPRDESKDQAQPEIAQRWPERL
jgi:hypothetical protein